MAEPWTKHDLEVLSTQLQLLRAAIDEVDRQIARQRQIKSSGEDIDNAPALEQTVLWASEKAKLVARVGRRMVRNAMERQGRGGRGTSAFL